MFSNLETMEPKIFLSPPSWNKFSLFPEDARCESRVLFKEVSKRMDACTNVIPDAMDIVNTSNCQEEDMEDHEISSKEHLD
jgi:hypothetical protein